jgi:pimeloyl-ACP methyl ester carboxylesterase
MSSRVETPTEIRTVNVDIPEDELADLRRRITATRCPDMVIHNYRWRLSLAEGEPQYGNLEARLFERPVITVPTVTIGSDFDGAAADGGAYAGKFSGGYAHRVLDGIGHNVPQEAPGAFTDAILEVGGGLR